MRFLAPFLIFIFFSLSAEGQFVDLQIVDENDQPVIGAIAIDFLDKEYGPSDSRGIIRFPYDGGSLVQIFKEGYYIKVVELDWTSMKQSNLKVVLQSNDLKLDEVSVSAKRVPFTDTLLVQDFEFQDTNLFVLGYDYLVLSNLDWRVKWKSNNKGDYTKLERDPRGNIFLLNDDSASQVLIRANHIYFYPAVAIGQYNSYIKPLVAVIGESLILRNIQAEQMPLPISPYRPGNKGKSMTFPPFHNQGVEFFIYRKGKEPKPFYFSVDTNAVLLAHDAFMDAFNIAASMETHYDQFGVWQHEKLFDLDQAQKIYRRGYAKDLPIPIFKQEEQYLLFDRFKDSIIVLDHQAKINASHPFSIDDDFKDPLIIQDYSSDRLFALKEKRGMVSLFAIHQYRLSESQKVSLFARETKVHSEWLFFVDESNYLRRQKLQLP